VNLDEVSHEVTLTLKSTGTQLDNWDQYTITQDMFNVGSPWAFTLWRSGSTESAWRRMLNEVRLGDTVIVAIDGAPQVTGRIESRVIGVDKDSGAKLTISGRDLSGPALDWDADPRIRLTKQVLGDTLAALFTPLGIPVVIGANADAAREVQTRARRGARGANSDTSVASGRHHRKHRRKRVDLSHARPGERVWQVAESIVRKLGYMLWVAPDADGKLAVIVDTPNYDQETTYVFGRRIIEGEVTRDSGILESSLECSIRDIPTVVYAFGRAQRGDQRAARHVTGVSRRSVFARPLGDDTGFWMRSGLPDLLGRGDNPGTLEDMGPRFGSLPAPATSGEQNATSPSQPTAARSPILTRQAYQNESLQSEVGDALVISPLPPQPRFLYSKRARNPETAEQEAKRVIAEAMRKFREYKCTVRHHGQFVDGQLRLFAINTMALVYDRVSELDREEMLITRVTFSGSRNKGQLTQLTLGTKGMVVLTPDDGT